MICCLQLKNQENWWCNSIWVQRPENQGAGCVSSGPSLKTQEPAASMPEGRRGWTSSCCRERRCPSSAFSGLPWWLRGWCVCLQCGRPGFNPQVRKIPWRRKWQPTPVLLPGKFHGWRSPWDCKESHTTEHLHFCLFVLFGPQTDWTMPICTGEGCCLFSLPIQLISSGEALTDPPRNHILPAFYAPLSPAKWTHRISHHRRTHALELPQDPAGARWALKLSHRHRTVYTRTCAWCKDPGRWHPLPGLHAQWGDRPAARVKASRGMKHRPSLPHLCSLKATPCLVHLSICLPGPGPSIGGTNKGCPPGPPGIG